jgi:N-acetylmannosamine-6-phosphate 2-epimerase / N-acetylmannosamine kinase
VTTTLAIDLGGSKILAALVSEGRVTDRAETATDRTVGPDAWIADMAGLSAPWAGRYTALGITVTGLVHNGLWTALNPATLGIPADFPLADQVRDRFGMAPVLANDAQAAAWGEYTHGSGAGRDMVFFTISTGIGGGVVTGGRLLTGRSGLAGSFGQLTPLGEDGPRIEDLTSGLWMLSEAAAHGHQAEARAVFAAAQNGEGWADSIIQTSATRAARLCHSAQLLFDPAVIVIGGGIGLAPGYLDRVEALLRDLPEIQRPTLARAALGADAGAVGIAALATQPTPTGRD